MLCPLPWFHLYADEKGYFYPCCFCDKSLGPLKNVNGEPIHAGSNDYLLQLENAPSLKNMRREMLKGEAPLYCQGCKKSEVAGIKSFRQRSLERMPIDRSSNLKEEAPLKLTSIDIRLGNNCDLACRMCSPTSSINLYKPFMEFHKQQDESLKNINWYRSDKFWQKLLEHSDEFVFLYFAGGEPLRSQKLPQILQELVDKNRAQYIWLSINTNLNHIPDCAQTIWKRFKGIDLTISIDGVGKTNDYIRYPSKWDNIQSNILEIDQHPERYNIKDCTIHSVVQIYNIFNLTQIIEFCSKFQSIHREPLFDFIIGDPALDIQVLPTVIKKELTQKLQKRVVQLQDGNLKSQLLEIVRHLNEKDQSNLIPRFQELTSIFDKHYKQKLSDYIPELFDIHNL